MEELEQHSVEATMDGAGVPTQTDLLVTLSPEDKRCLFEKLDLLAEQLWHQPKQRGASHGDAC